MTLYGPHAQKMLLAPALRCELSPYADTAESTFSVPVVFNHRSLFVRHAESLNRDLFPATRQFVAFGPQHLKYLRATAQSRAGCTCSRERANVSPGRNTVTRSLVSRKEAGSGAAWRGKC